MMNFLEASVAEFFIQVTERNPYLLECAPDQYKTQELCERAVLEWSFTWLKCVPDQCKTRENDERAVLKLPFTLERVLDQYKTQ